MSVLPAEVADAVVRSLIGDAKRVVVKVGSQVLCGPDGLILDPILRGLCAVLAEQIGRGRQVVLVSSGAVATGRGATGQVPGAAETGGALGKQALAAIGQSVLMARYRELLSPHGIVVGQVLLTHADLGDRRRFLHARRVVSELLAYGALPVVNENDTVAVEEIKFGDNDALAAQVAQLVEADVLVLLTEVDGLFTADPRLDPNATLLQAVGANDEAALAIAGESSGTFGTGGMRSKVLAAQRAASVGIPTVVAHGQKPEQLTAILEGSAVGTVFIPAARKFTGKRKWIVSSVRPKGTVTLDRGAALAMLRDGRSLLPIGVTAVDGRFGVGDAVNLTGPSGALIGRGLSRYDAEDARRVVGLRTPQISGVLGWLPARELVHRDDFVAARTARIEDH